MGRCVRLMERLRPTKGQSSAYVEYAPISSDQMHDIESEKAVRGKDFSKEVRKNNARRSLPLYSLIRGNHAAIRKSEEMKFDTHNQVNDKMNDSTAVYSESLTKDQFGREFCEVVIHPFVEMIADDSGEPIDDGEWTNASGGEYSDEFGNDLDDYPDEMFRKGWSVTSWVDDNGNVDIVDEQEFPDRTSALARAQELAARYRVNIDHSY